MVGMTLGLGLACGNGDDSSSSDGSCVSTREFYTTQVYGRALSQCRSCHTPGGSAIEEGAKFIIYRETYPDFVSVNVAGMRDYSKLEVDGKPVLLQKPLGKRNHGGGTVLDSQSEDFKILSKFVTDLRAGTNTTCNDEGALGVEELGTNETIRKAALVLAGRYPTDEEFKSGSTPEGFDALVTSFTREEPFYDVLREAWNDALLTDRALDAGVGSIYGQAPELYDDRYPGYTPENRSLTTRSITEEPMRFVEYVVRNDRPFSEVVSGGYLVANPFTAKLYGVPHTQAMIADNLLEWERVDFAPAQVQTRNGASKLVPVPVAGVLTTASFLNRWETTPTNKGRKRARVLLKSFLATDILKFGTRPVDSTALTSVQNPESNSAECSVCHTVVDPIAGGFRGFDEGRLQQFNPDDKWHDDMLPPGINSVQMPPTNYTNASMWMGPQIAADPRFGIAVAQVMYQALVGDEPLTFPTDNAAAGYQDKVKAFTLQSDWLVQAGQDFMRNNYDLRRLVVNIVKSPYFRARSGDVDRDAIHSGLGQGRLLTPEMLARKTKATTGLYFFTGEQIAYDPTRKRDGFLRNEIVSDTNWRLLYGGIDSNETTKRLELMTPVMLAASQYFASVTACRATSFDFTKPAADRRLFKQVEMSTVPFSPRANKTLELVAVPGNEAKIRENIQYLFFRLLGEDVATDSDTVNQTYQLFVDVWKDFEQTNLDTPRGATSLGGGRCNATIDYDKPATFMNVNGQARPVYTQLQPRPDKADYTPGMVLDRDENFTVRSWQAVVSFMLMDYRFTHE